MTNFPRRPSPDNRPRLRGVFFDLDNTLTPFRTVVTVSAAAFARCFAVEERSVRRAIWEAYEARFGYGTSGYAELATLSLWEFRRRLMLEMLARLGIEETADAEAVLRAVMEAERSALALAPDAMETLSALRAAGLKVGLITNGPSALQREKLAVLALADLLDSAIVDTEFGHPKPDRRIFEHAAAAVGLAPDELLFVGDSLPQDIAGACAAGWIAVWYNPENAPLPSKGPAPDYTIRAFTGLLTLDPVAAALPAERHTG